jgi:hypothetical protein
VKVISSKVGSTRERVDVEADMVHVAAWRVAWEPSDEPGFVRPTRERHVVLSSRFGAERSTELWLTEAEAIAIAQTIAHDLLTSAVERLNKPQNPVTGGQGGKT